MFKRSEKKIKAVFKMQFKATQVPQLKAKSLMISLVPVGVGKPTVRLPKSPIIEGTCTWENPVFETLKLVQETKTGRIREKFYYLVVATGSSKSGFLGEVSIDFADLSEATKPLNLILPLQTSKSGAILHVTVQRVQGGPGSRHDDDNEAPEDESYDRNLDTEGRDSYSFRKRNPKSPDSDNLSEVSTLHDEQNGSFEDGVSDHYDAESRDGVKETPNDMFGRLTSQMKMFERKAELSELEVQGLRKQIMKETSRGQQLSDQLILLREERDVLKAECERHKSQSTNMNSEAVSGHTNKDTENLVSSLDKTKQDLQRHKDWNKKLKVQVQKAEDSNSEFVLAVRDLSKKLDQKNTEISRLTGKIKALHSGSDVLEASPRATMNLHQESKAIDESEMLKQKIDELYSQIEVHKKEKDEMRMDIERLNLDYESLETENKDIYAKLEQRENEKMEIQQNYIDSSATERNLKLQVASLEAENKRQALQYSESLNMIDDLEFQIESLQKEFEKQAEVFQDELDAVTEAKVEQEQRAVRAEEALRKTKLSGRNTAERLQEEFTQISAEMALKIEENEILAQEAVTEANDLHQKNEVLEELLRKAKEELHIIGDQYENILREHSEMAKQKIILGEESEQMKATIMEESEMLHRWKSEKEDLERQLASGRQEAEKLADENVSMKSQIDLKKTKEENLLLEMKKLRLKNNEVKNLMLELQSEKESLKKEKFKLQESLRKKEQERERAALSQVKEKNIKHNTKAVEINVETNRLQNIPAKQLDQESMAAEQTSSLLSEVASLKEKNKGMDEELKDMRERYSEISLKFAEVEGERQQLVMTLRNLKSGKKN
ncbi:hypothetical protein CASFOL_003187 [Castilleja foliolosa]|uniref:C2 NT-type domain-containing protein n=1 Tax=Castilleja foliolosa TaxID=1961234 RepID=A0ABD3EH48_9LAMI